MLITSIFPGQSFFVVTQDPNGVAAFSSARGSIAIRSDAGNEGVWINTDGATTWALVGPGGGGGGGGWTDDGANVRLTTAADTVTVGTAVPVASRKMVVQTTGVAQGIQIAGTNPAGTDVAIESLVSGGGANPSLQVNNLGRIQWGPGGGTALDTQLQRAVAGILELDHIGGTSSALQFTDGQTAAVSPANQGRLRYNAGTNQFEISMNAAAYVPIATAVTGGGWTDAGAFVLLTTVTDQVTIGGVAAIAGRKLEVQTTAGNQGIRITPTAATDNVLDALVSGEANASWQVLGRGETLWGAGGGSALDTRLRRTAAAELTLDNGAAGAATLLPGADGVGALGANAQRWGLIRGVTITSGAYYEEEVFDEEFLALQERLGVLEAEMSQQYVEIVERPVRHLARIVMLTARSVLDLAKKLQ